MADDFLFLPYFRQNLFPWDLCLVAGGHGCVYGNWGFKWPSNHQLKKYTKSTRSRIRIWPQFRCIPNRTKYQGLGTNLVRILNLLKYIHSFPLNILHYPGGPPSLPSTSSLAVTSLPLNTYPTLFSGERQNDKINGFQNNEKVAFWVTQGSGVFSLDCDLQVIKCIVDS